MTTQNRPPLTLSEINSRLDTLRATAYELQQKAFPRGIVPEDFWEDQRYLETAGDVDYLTADQRAYKHAQREIDRFYTEHFSIICGIVGVD